MSLRGLCLAFSLFSFAAFAQSPLGLSFIETKDLKLIYFDSLEYLVPHTTRSFTNSIDWQRSTFGWIPSEPTTILLKDQSDYGNASQMSAPRSRLYVDIAPLSHAFETFPASERMFSLMNHEMVHVMSGDIGSEVERGWRRFFLGKVAPQAQHPESMLYSYLTVPRFTSPRWYNEGSAVFMETWMGGGVGRAQGGYDEMVFRAMVRDHAHFYDPLGLVSRGVRVDFQTGANAYLYGTRFFTWLAYAFTPEKVVEWLRRDDDSARYYSDQFARVFGISLEQAWQDWVAFEHDFQQRNLSAVRTHPITPHTSLVAGAVGSVSRIYFDETTQTLFGAFRYPGTVEHVGSIDARDGSLRHLADIKRAMHYRVASLAFDPVSGTAFYTNDNLAHRDLMAVDVKSGESRLLLENSRIGEIVFNPADQSLIGVRHENGMASLVQIPPPYDTWSIVHEFPYEFVPSDLDISPDGRLLSASISEVNGDQFLRVWELSQLRAGNLVPLSEFHFGQSVPESFVFSRDGRYLYGSSYYTGVSNIFRYEVATGKVEAVSNAESGFFRPVPLSDGRLLILTYTSEGFVPATIQPTPIDDVSAIKFLGAELAARHPVVTRWQVPPPSRVDYEKQVVARGPFDPLSNLSIDNAFPVLQGYKDSIGIGYHMNIGDPLGFAKIGMTAAFTPDSSLQSDEQSHIAIDGEYLGWRGELSWNKSDFYDLFGPTKRSRKGTAIKLGYDDLLIYDEPRRMTLKYDLIHLDGIDTLPQAQNVDATFSRLVSAQVGLYFSDVRRSLGAVDDEKGYKYSVAAGVTNAGNTVVSGIVGAAAIGIPLPFDHTSIWLRGALGAVSGDRDNSLANFYFGGFGNNYVDSHEVKRYHEHESMPGFEINEISGQDFAKATVELNLSPIIFEQLGTSAFHATWLRPSIFATTLHTDLTDSAMRRSWQSIGAQADIRFSIMHWNELTLSFGYARSTSDNGRDSDEVMVSLKIM